MPFTRYHDSNWRLDEVFRRRSEAVCSRSTPVISWHHPVKKTPPIISSVSTTHTQLIWTYISYIKCEKQAVLDILALFFLLSLFDAAVSHQPSALQVSVLVLFLRFISPRLLPDIYSCRDCGEAQIDLRLSLCGQPHRKCLRNGFFTSAVKADEDPALSAASVNTVSTSPSREP